MTEKQLKNREYWMNIIKQMEELPEQEYVTAWLTKQGILRTKYYYWRNRLLMEGEKLGDDTVAIARRKKREAHIKAECEIKSRKEVARDIGISYSTLAHTMIGSNKYQKGGKTWKSQ